MPAETLNRYGITGESMTVSDLVARPLVDLPEVQEILREVGGLVGTVVASLIRVFNPDMVILSGELVETGDVIPNAVVGEVESRIPRHAREKVRIVRSSMVEDPRLMGVYALVLEKIFRMENWARQA